MNSMMSHFKLLLGKINRQYIQLLLLIITLSLFVLGAGAPGTGGGPGGW